MNVQELIERLEELPQSLPVCVNGEEISEVVVRDEQYFAEDFQYADGPIVKIY